MDFKETLAGFKKKVDFEIETFFDRKIKEISQEDAWVTEGMEYVKKLTLAGGKRLRPALMYWGYKACGGKDEEKIIKAAVGVELTHIFLLIHDDIIDRSDRRHNLETVNFWAERKGKEMFEFGDKRRFGYSIAMILGDMTYNWAVQAIIDAGLDAEKTLQALHYLQSVVATTCIGESQDVVIEYKSNVKEKEIIQMCTNKTAKYTFEGPLHLGAKLAGADQETLKSFSDYSIPVGIAFQMQDDILGVFGSEEKLGKSVASDIIEGKKTILTARVFSDGNIFQQERLRDLLGKKDITSDGINEFQQIVMDSGALKYAKQTAREYAKKGVDVISNSKIETEAKEFLGAMAEYIINREI
ncbi:MAG: hypothetical protein ACD_11C00027G0004 [uncultured bacterium]|nr:MAG: hypothetical protein ACD_11C00027G0004 [uncultured bacterium]HBR72066.1 hypothetical protein [Candidatus Moranbacteria bacterium]